MNVSREDKLRKLGFEKYANIIHDQMLDIFYDKFINATLEDSVDIENDNIYETMLSKIKELIALKYVNKLLINIGREKITNITDFSNINRDDIIKEDNKKICDEMIEEIFGPFNKGKCGYYRKNSEQYALTLLKGIVNEIGYVLKKKNEDKIIKGERKWIVTYTIIKK